MTASPSRAEAHNGSRGSDLAHRHPIAPVAAIDHVLVDAGCAVPSFDVFPLPGSDHRALVAEIVLPQ